MLTLPTTSHLPNQVPSTTKWKRCWVSQTECWKDTPHVQARRQFDMPLEETGLLQRSSASSWSRPWPWKALLIPPGGSMVQVSHLVRRHFCLRLNTSPASSLESEVRWISFTETGTSCKGSGANTALCFYGGLSGRPRNKKGGADPMIMLIQKLGTNQVKVKLI